tara:strand:+ start:187 stop:798 length:612 start_codon:yes stop_codon:yes gene_type:complete
MTSKLIVNSIRHTGASADAITMDASGNVTFPANATCSGTATGFGGGITEIDYWRLTSNFQGNAYHIQNNWERFDSQTEDKKGTGMSESSGLFTFPSTGYYYVEFNLTGYRGAGSQIYNITQYIRTTTSGDTSSGTDYNLSNNTSMYSPANNSHYTQSARTIFKCTNTSTHKVFFGCQAEASIYIQGNTNESFTYAVFIRLADI